MPRYAERQLAACRAAMASASAMVAARIGSFMATSASGKTSAPPWLAEHGRDDGRPASLDGAQDFEAMPFVQRDVPGVGRFEVGEHPVTVADVRRMPHQGAAQALALPSRI